MMTVTQIVKKFRERYRIRRFINIFTEAYQWSLFWVRFIQNRRCRIITTSNAC